MDREGNMGITRRMATLAMGALALGGFTPARAQGIALKWAHVYEADEPYHQQALWAADEIRKRTDGAVEVSVFPAAKLGNENQINEALASGTVDIIYTGAGFPGQLYPPISIIHAPYTIRDYDHWSAFRNSDLFSGFCDEYEKKSGQRAVALTYYGQRHVTANRRIDHPDDMHGMKLRVPPLALFLMFTRAMGAEAVPIAFADVYNALRQGKVEGQENPLPTILAKKFHQVQSHVMLTAHITDSLLTVVGEHVWPALGSEQRMVIEDVLRQAAGRASAQVRETELRLVQDLAGMGMTIVEVDRQPFVDAVLPLHNDASLGAGWSRQHYDTLQAL